MLPPPRITNGEHEAEAASLPGGHRSSNAESAGIFTLGLPWPDWHGLVLSVADGNGYGGAGDLASAAVLDAFEEAFRQWGDQLGLDTGAWQRRVGEAFFAAFDHANARVRSLLGGAGTRPEPGAGLVAAAMLGDWLCVVSAGPGRVYRLSRGAIESLTADPRHRPSLPGVAPSPLGITTRVAPAISFHHLRPGDVVVVCSDGLARTLHRDDLTRLIGSADSVADIAKSLALAGQRTDDDADMTAVVARVRSLPRRSLPGALRRLTSASGEFGELAHRFPALTASSRQSILLVAALGLLVLLGGTLGIRRLILGGVRPGLAPVILSGAPRLPSYAPPVQPPPVAASPVAGDLPTIQTPLRAVIPARRPRPDAPVATRPTTSPQPRAFNASLAAKARLSALERIRDSLMAEESAKAAARQAADRSAAQAEAGKRQAQDSAARVAANTQSRREHLAAGYRALNEWVSTLAASVNGAELTAPVLVAGPAEFVAFVSRDHPVLTGERLVTSRVDEAGAEASAEWLVQWRTAFGTTTSRRMRASASVTPDGSGWSLQRWIITDGTP